MARKIRMTSRKTLSGVKRRKAALPKVRRKKAIKKLKAAVKRRYSR